ncbi:MAG: hypothetical protein KAR35_00640 [Candidatus Heimdallarchaeota archaeon]|nr:hypothetical protein [Candidatus Heimdallarchaeota archaeon]MCK5047859.1 hypothetical protein [Candidatus Heimdallarchaeota archaeon]
MKDMAEVVVSSDEEYDNPSLIFDIARIIQISFLIIVIGAITSYFLDDDFSSQSIYDTTMNVCLGICLITSIILGGQICGSQSFAGNRRLLYSIGHKERLRTYNRELLRRGHLGYAGIIWFSSFILVAVAFIRWFISEM